MNFEFGNPGAAPATYMPREGRQEQVESTAEVAPPKKDDAGEKLAAEMAVFNQVAAELREKRNPAATRDERAQCVVATATELFGVAPTWTAFYREIVGVGGVVRALFPDADELFEFECSEEHAKVLEMLTVLRSRDLPDCDPTELQRMITVRIPKSLHDAICDEANQLAVSVNKLCITRLIQRVDRSLIPSSSQKRRGRRPGAAYAKSSVVETLKADAEKA